jgi:hypothetical protein
VRSAEGMVKLALARAKTLSEAEQLDWPQQDLPVLKALMGQLLSVSEFIELDDVSVTHCFKLWSRSPDPVLSRLCQGLIQRRVYKSIDLSRFDDVKPIVAQVERAIASAGGEPSYDLFYDEPSDTPYAADSSEILVRERDGTLREFASISPLSQVLNRQLMFKRLHVAPQWRDLAEDVVRAVKT